MLKGDNLLNKINNITFKKQLNVSSLLVALFMLPSLAMAEERWFEVEVILFKQLGDKSELQETFPDNISPVKRKRFYDLIEPSLQPDVSLLKQTLPRCDGQSPFFDLSLPLAVIKDQTDELLTDSQQAVLDQSNTQNEGVPSPSTQQIQAIDVASTSDADAASAQQTVDENEAFWGTELNDKPTPPFSLEDALADIVWHEKAAAEIDAIEHSIDIALAEQARYGENLKAFELPDITNVSLCVTQEEINSKPHPLYGFDVNAIPIDTVPLQVSDIETPFSSTPYLLSNDSLQLNYIVNQLRRSREFRPLLHLGWRQATLSKRQARPIKIVAGDNLNRLYEKQLHTLNPTFIDDGITSLNHEQDTLVGQQLNDIITKAIERSFDSNTVITQAKNVTKPGLLKTFPAAGAINGDAASNLVPPTQDYWLDGFITIHLNHYLYISAEFNLMNDIDVNFTEEAPSKAIKFHQNDRRVISGQIHYFDHPYIGMVVQIRKYQQPENDDINEIDESPSVAKNE